MFLSFILSYFCMFINTTFGPMQAYISFYYSAPLLCCGSTRTRFQVQVLGTGTMYRYQVQVLGTGTRYRYQVQVLGTGQVLCTGNRYSNQVQELGTGTRYRYKVQEIGTGTRYNVIVFSKSPTYFVPTYDVLRTKMEQNILFRTSVV